MPQNAVSDQVLHCLLTECSIKIWTNLKNTTQHPLKWKWTGPTDSSGKFHLAKMGEFNCTSRFLETTFFTTAGNKSEASLPLATIWKTEIKIRSFQRIIWHYSLRNDNFLLPKQTVIGKFHSWFWANLAYFWSGWVHVFDPIYVTPYMAKKNPCLFHTACHHK